MTTDTRLRTATAETLAPPTDYPRSQHPFAEQPALSIRARVHDEDAAQFIRDALRDIRAYMQEHHVNAAGPPFSICLPVPPDRLDIEAGWPLEVPVDGTGRIHSSSLPPTFLRNPTR
jgi:hypothetical protein